MTSHAEDDVARDSALRALLVERVRARDHRSRALTVVLAAVGSVWLVALFSLALPQSKMLKR
jgi:hypothetical protein